MGCLPIVITLYSDNAIQHRDCIGYFSLVAESYNSMLQNELKAMQFSKASFGARIGYLDIYGPLIEMIIGRRFGEYLHLSFYLYIQITLHERKQCQYKSSYIGNLFVLFSSLQSLIGRHVISCMFKFWHAINMKLELCHVKCI